MAKKVENTAAPVGEGVYELESLAGEWWWFVLLGMALIVMGMIGIAAPLAFGVTTAAIFGVLLLVGGAAQIISSFWAGKWSGFFVGLFTGILYLVVGALIVDQPLKGLTALTILLAAFFMVEGLFKIVASLYLKYTHWGWSLLSGFVTLFLGILIWRNFPEAVPWVIGLFVGLEFMFNGWTWVMLGMGLRSITEE